MGSDEERAREYCALHRRCEGEWIRWATDETVPVPEQAAVGIENRRRIGVADLLHRFRLYQRLGGCGDVGEIPDAR